MRSFLVFIALLCAALLGAAVYLQITKEMAPCPWCIIQRYIFLAIGVVCLIGAFLPAVFLRFVAMLGTLLALAGTAAAGWLLYTHLVPTVSCGIDPMESSINTLLPAKMFPLLFESQGMCSTIYDDILGLSVSQWSTLWFVFLTIVLAMASLRRKS